MQDTKNKQLITVIPVYNGGKYLHHTLKSIARQTVKPSRVIIQDNHSTDNTREIYYGFKHLGYEWNPTPRHCSVVENLNWALELSGITDFLHIIAADDLINPDFYEQAIKATEILTPGPALIYGSYGVIDANGNIYSNGYSDSPFHATKEGKPRCIPLDKFLCRQSELFTICMPVTLMRTCYQLPPVSFRKDRIQMLDVLFYAELAAAGYNIVEIPRMLGQWCHHEDSVTGSNRKRLPELVQDEWRAMMEIQAMIPMNRMQRWLWQQRLKVLMAARIRIRTKVLQDCHGKLKAEMDCQASKMHGAMHYRLARVELCVCVVCCLVCIIEDLVFVPYATR